MKQLIWLITDAAHYLTASTAWHLTNITGLSWDFDKRGNVTKLGSFVIGLLGDRAYWDDPWVQYQRWTKRGYNMDFLLESDVK